jgi:outer membrane lipoprotein SlyB
VLIAADGKRSQPYEKTFNIAPGSLRPPSITTILVPNVMHVGQTFSFNLVYDAPDADIVQIQRRLLESSIKWPQEQTTLNVPGAAGHRSGSVSYAFPAAQVPYTATAEFVLVDVHGNRSEPRRMSFEVLPATATAQTADRMRNNQQNGYRDAGGNAFCSNCATVIGVREVAQGGEATGAGAIVGGLLGGVLGDQAGHGRGNDPATAAGAIAGALAGHQVEKNVRSSKSYEITVRYNDGHAEVMRQRTLPQWRNGDRVQIVNGVLRYAP